VSSLIWTTRPDYISQAVAGLLLWGTHSDERTGLSFTIAAGSRQRSHTRVLVPRRYLRFETYNTWRVTELKSQNYVTTDGQSANLSWCQAPIWGLRPDFYYCQTVAGLLMWGALADKRTGLPFTIAAGPRQHIHSWVRLPRDS
jgi:hypothetical protein